MAPLPGAKGQRPPLPLCAPFSGFPLGVIINRHHGHSRPLFKTSIFHQHRHQQQRASKRAHLLELLVLVCAPHTKCTTTLGGAAHPKACCLSSSARARCRLAAAAHRPARPPFFSYVHARQQCGGKGGRSSAVRARARARARSRPFFLFRIL